MYEEIDCFFLVFSSMVPDSYLSIINYHSINWLKWLSSTIEIWLHRHYGKSDSKIFALNICVT